MTSTAEQIRGKAAQRSAPAASAANGNPVPTAPRRLPLKLILSLALCGAAIPVVVAERQPEPWLASVTLGIEGTAPPAVLDIALREVQTSKMLGRAVDILGLEKDPEFSGSASTGLGVALEILTGETKGPADARRRAIEHLKTAIAVTRKPGSPDAQLLVRAGTSEKAMKIAEALATVYASGTELTGAIPSAADTARQARVEKAEAALADFTAQVGADKLSAALVVKSRMQGLDEHMANMGAVPDTAGTLLDKASFKDVLDGRLPLAKVDSDLDQLRQSYITARMAAGSLAMTLGPRHPKLLAAQGEVETARRALADQFGRVKKTFAKAREAEANTLKSLKAQRDELDRQLRATGIDLARHEQLVADLESARKDEAKPDPDRIDVTGSILQASVPRSIGEPAGGASSWQIALGTLAGAALALTYAAWRRFGRGATLPNPQARPGKAALQPLRKEPALAKPQTAMPVTTAATARPLMSSVQAPVAISPAEASDVLPASARTGIEMQLAAIRARRRALDAANAVPLPADPYEGIPLAVGFPEEVLPGFERIERREPPLVEKLRQVAPQMFSDPAAEAEMERLREELAELRHRVIRRASGRS